MAAEQPGEQERHTAPRRPIDPQRPVEPHDDSAPPYPAPDAARPEQAEDRQAEHGQAQPEQAHQAEQPQPGQTRQPEGEQTPYSEAEGDQAPSDTDPDTDADGEVRAAERSAERAAALAATEGFHPLRVRPYVTEPGDPSAGGSTVRPVLLAPVRDSGPETADLGLFAEQYTALEYSQDDPGHDGYGGYDGSPGTDAYPYEDDGRPGDDERQAQAAALHGRHRRRRRRLVVAAAAVAASALAAGAVAMTGQVMGDDQGPTGYALPDSAGPEITLPPGSEPATPGAKPPVLHRAAPPTATAPTSPSTSPSASFSAAPPTTAPPAALDAPRTSAAESTVPTPPASPETTAPPAPPTTQPPADAPDVLRLGDSGPAVAELQHLLAEAHAYYGPIDGVFDQGVRQAVSTFQIWHWVSDEPDGSHDGVYGPNTRAALEHQTSHSGSHHH